MSFLAPWALLLGALAGVPLLLHLLRRRSGTRVDFPAVRYLLRAEREHAREVKLRNFLLMLLRVAIVLAIALAAARPFGPLPGAGHPPTALVILLDNSMSSGAASAEGPTLGSLRRAATALLDAARDGDALTLVTMDGAATAGRAADLRTAVDALEPLVGAGDPLAAWQRASALLNASDLPERRLAVLTDGQRSSWADSTLFAPLAWPVTLFVPDRDTVRNRALRGVTVSPRQWTPRGTLRATWTGDTASWRLVLDGRSEARGTQTASTPIVARVQPLARGWLAGALELDPDELRGDDSRHFAVFVGDPPAVEVTGTDADFLRGAADALVDDGRARRGAGIRLSDAAAARRPGVFVAPRDPLRVSDANRALAQAGIPWRYGARRSGNAPLRGDGVDAAVASVWYDLQFTGAASVGADTLVRVGAAPWAVAGDGYVLLASALHPDHGSLPLRAEFLPWLDRVLAEHLTDAGGSARELTPGREVAVPAGVTAVERADGTREAVAAGQRWRAPQMAGVHFWLQGDRRAGALVVNPDVAESDLAPMPGDSLAARLSAPRVHTRVEPFARATYAGGSRRALDLPLLLLALGLLLVESWMARRGRAAAGAE